MNPLQSGMRPTSRNIQLHWTQRRAATLHIFVCLSHLATAEELLQSCKKQLHQRWWTPYWESENRSRETASHEQEHQYSRVGAGNKTISKSPTSFDQIKHKNSDQTISKTTNFTYINKNLPSRYTQSCRSRRNNNRNRQAACITSSEGEEAVGMSDRRRASGRRRARERSRLRRRMKEDETCPVQDSCGRSQLPTYLPGLYQVGRKGRIFTGCCNWVEKAQHTSSTMVRLSGYSPDWWTSTLTSRIPWWKLKAKCGWVGTCFDWG
jgi:hypothetical protein